MAVNSTDKSESIYIDLDYENIFLVDPNSVNGENGKEDRYVKHENLVMYANLECKLTPRSKLVYGVANNQVGSETVTIGKINFLKPGDREFLSDNYLGELLGTDAAVNTARSINYLQQQGQSIGDLRDNIRNDGNLIDNGFLGISNIQMRTNASFTPTVTITLVDVRGRSMFEQGNNSPYAAFFTLPYPVFYLTLKGFYGKAVRYPLLLQKFNSSYDSSSGNFIVTLVFIAYKYGPFGEITLGEVLATPHMYTSKFTITKQTNTSNSNNQSVSEVQTSQKGFQKMVQLYDRYRSNGTLPPNFPNITVQELQYKLDKFVQDVLTNSGQVDFQPLTDCDTYLENVEKYQGEVYLYGGGDSWFNQYMDGVNFFVDKVTKRKYYTFKTKFDTKGRTGEITQQEKTNSVEELNKIILKYNELLNKSSLSLPSKINIEDLKISFTTDQIDIEETYIARYRKQPPTSGLTEFTASLSKVIGGAVAVNSDGSNITSVPNQFFVFEGNESTFMYYTNELKKKSIERRKEYEEKIAGELEKILTSPNGNGIGFSPTIRNIIAVFVVSVEAFYGLLDDVHSKAYEQRNNEYRKGKFTINDVNCNNTSQPVVTSEVFPWPLFTVKETTASGDTKYEIAYPGEPEYQNAVQSQNYEIWPEVEFVEEFVKGYSQRESTPNPYVSNQNENKDVYRLSLSTFDAPINSLIFSDKDETKFFYEIIERIMLQTYYQGFDREENQKTQLINLITEATSKSITSSIGTSNPYLLDLLVNYKPDVAGYNDYLKHISNNGTGESWNKYIRDRFVTKEIYETTQVPSKLYFNFPVDFSQPIPDFNKPESLTSYFQGSTHNKYYFYDTLPFISNDWISSNISDGKSITNYDLFNSTSQSIMFNTTLKTVTNYDKNTDFDFNRPVTNFNYRKSQQINTSNFNNDFYTNLLSDSKNSLVTIGGVFYENYNGLMSQAQCTSIFNTPFFTNSIQNGVHNEKNGSSIAYVQSAYLFLNSLPLATLRERYKKYMEVTGTGTGNQNYTELDYIASSFRKFGGLHKLPYAWILKYGSIWYRYKTYLETGVDILDDCWASFDYQSNYNPINGNTDTTYTVTSTTETFNITLKNIDLISLPGLVYETISLGFYPKLINDFSYFYNGYDLIDLNYTNINNTMSYYLSDGTFKMYSPNSTRITSNESTYDPELYLNISTYSCTLKNTINNDGSYYVLPSFGSNVNQLYYEFFNTGTSDLQKDFDVPGTYNGSVRLDWSNPHFGYFDPTGITKPNYDEYMSNIHSDSKQQNEFTFIYQNGYSKIEDIFGVFTKEELDIFEQEFLKFSQPQKGYSSANSEVTTISEYKNFQMIMKLLLKVPNLSGSSSQQVISQIQNNQFSNKLQTLTQFLNVDVVLKRANPYDYNRAIYDSFFSDSTTQLVVDPIDFGSYRILTPNALPTSSNITTLLGSQTTYPNEWTALREYVGFSTIGGNVYSNTGSSITNFFDIFDIPFTENNIKLLAPIIKLYSSYVFKNPTNTSSDFIVDNRLYLVNKSLFKNNVLNNTLNTLQKTLPAIKIESIKTISSSLVGGKEKVEYYDMFKALNDKWVAANNFDQDSFMESFLFLDKASRDVGDKILVDIFKVNDKIKKVDPATSIYTIIAEILKDHHFVTFTMPGYINFYNQKNGSGGPQESANLMFGTFTEVDYTDTNTKFVNILSSDPSSNTLIDTKQNGFCDDSFRIDKAQDNPLKVVDGSTGNEKSNKVVGFAVDFGLQKQSMFYNLNLAQDIGKATSESLLMQYELSQLTNGKRSQTQNVSLFNLYKNRSYSCTVQSMGNATIQPVMYFTLRNVPMFSGPYLILEVNHSIAPGSFETTFSGVRQKIYTLPDQQGLLTSLKLEISKNYYEQVKKEKNRQAASATTVTAANQQTTNSVTQNPVDTKNESCETNSAYSSYVKITGDSKTLSYNEVIEQIGLVADTLQKKAALFTIIYLSNNSNGNIKFFNNNLTNVNLSRKWAGNLPTKFDKEYTCLTFGDKLSPIVKFPNISYNLQFMDLYLKNYYSDLVYSTDITIVEDLTKFYIKYWSLQTQQDDAYFGNYISTNALSYGSIKDKVAQAYAILNPVNLNVPTTATTETTLTNNLPTPPLTSNYQYTISNPPMFEELTVTVDPSIDGPRVIFAVTFDYDITAPCSDGTGVAQQFSNNYISSNGQTFHITAEDLLEEMDCTGNDGNGNYKFKIEIDTRPVLENGQTDTTRSDYYQTYNINMTF
jgi:hypothetical protein